MSGRRQQLSQPSWNPLSDDGSSPSASEEPSEDEILESSQDIRNEITSSSTLNPPPRKRKPSNTRSPRGPTIAKSDANKRPRLGDIESHATGSSTSRRSSGEDDIPASAHARPLRRPPVPLNSIRRSSLPGKRTASASKTSDNRFALETAPAKRVLNVSRKPVSSASSKSAKPGSSTSTSVIRPKFSNKDQDRRKTLPANLDQIDLTTLSEDEINLFAVPRKQAVPGKVVAPLQVAGKKIETLGGQDNPILLSDSEEDNPPDQPEHDDIPMSHDDLDPHEHPLAEPGPSPTPEGGAPPRSSPSASPTRRIRIQDTLYSGPSGFFKAVHQRRASNSQGAPRSAASGSAPPAAHSSVQSPALSLQEERMSDGYSSSAVGGRELPPSSEASRSVSKEQSSRNASTSNLPLAEPKTEAAPDKAISSGISPPASRSEVGNTSLTHTVVAARFAQAQQSGQVIDLTLSDDEDDTRPTTWSDPKAVAATTDYLADMVPALFNDALPIGPQPSIPAPTLRNPPPILDIMRALQRKGAQKERSLRPASSGGSGSDSFPVSRKASVSIPTIKTEKPLPAPSSAEDEIADVQEEMQAEQAASTSDDMDVDREPSPIIRRPRGRPPRKALRAVSPEASGSEYGEDEPASETEIANILLPEARSESPESATEKRQYNLRDRKPVVKKPLAPPVPGPSRGRGRRPKATRNGPTEQALLPAMGQMAIYSDDDDSDPNVLTWKKNGHEMMREFAEHHVRAKDLSFNLQDRMMALPPAFRRADNMGVVAMQSSILVASGEDEPDAPAINIFNDIDYEPSPPFEFHYTNKMYHGEGVPEPSFDHLDHCNCVGYCKPETCPCAAKQAKWLRVANWKDNLLPPPNTFLYDNNGRIIPDLHDQHPIFECNAKCRCDDEWCRNRVVQKGRKVKVDIKKTLKKGWGVFAGENIPAHTFIGIYAGEILTDAEGTKRGEKYDKFGRTYLFNIDGHHITKWQQYHGREEVTNFCIDAFHAGNFTRYLNHSCKPNCNIVICYINESNIEKGLLTIWTVSDVTKGTELCFSYFGDPEETDFKPLSKKEKAKLQKTNSLCQCGERPCAKRMWRVQPDEDSTEGSTDGEN